MSSTEGFRPVVRVREAVVVSEPIRRTLDGLLVDETEVPERMYVSGHRIVDGQEFVRGGYHAEKRLAEEALKRFASQAILLSGRMRIVERKDVAHMVFEPREQEQAREIAAALEKIQTIEQPRPGQGVYFYMEVAARSMTRNVQQRREVMNRLSYVANNSTQQGRTHVAKPHILEAHIPTYPTNRLIFPFRESS